MGLPIFHASVSFISKWSISYVKYEELFFVDGFGGFLPVGMR